MDSIKKIKIYFFIINLFLFFYVLDVYGGDLNIEAEIELSMDKSSNEGYKRNSKNKDYYNKSYYEELQRDYLFVLSIIRKENPYIYKNYPYISQYIAYQLVRASLDNRFKKYNINQKTLLFLLMGIIKVESNFHPVAISYANAIGLMQIHAPTWKIKFNEGSNIEFNIFFGKEIFFHYLEKSNGSIKNALFLYLGAPQYSYALRVLTNANKYMSIYKKHFG